MTERFLAPLVTTDERHQDTSMHPFVHLFDVDSTCADLRMNVEVHEERRVPPFTQCLQNQRRVVELGTGAGFEVVDEARERAHGQAAAPAKDRRGCMLRHMLRRDQ